MASGKAGWASDYEGGEAMMTALASFPRRRESVICELRCAPDPRLREDDVGALGLSQK